jgi:hypothetical protein
MPKLAHANNWSFYWIAKPTVILDEMQCRGLTGSDIRLLGEVGRLALGWRNPGRIDRGWSCDHFHHWPSPTKTGRTRKAPGNMKPAPFCPRYV